ncbi:MAG: TIM barrel protein [Clostridia bacterium]|nr:TIM barrel protein [Clostridia bacterium]
MIKFGSSGNSLAYHNAGFDGSSHSAKWVKDMGLDCFEYSFGRGVNLSSEKACEIGKSFKENGVEISVHCPYFINFASPEEQKVINSYGYVLSSLEKGSLMGAKRAVFHPATQGKLSRIDAVSLATKNLETLAKLIEDNGYGNMLICPETMGKSAQIGTTKEIADFCTIAPFFYPCLDFGHINSLEQGSLNVKDDYLRLFDIIEKGCGFEKLNKMHVHFSKIMYGPKGEIKHLTFEDVEFGPMPEPFILAVKERGISPYIVSESAGTQDIDAKTLKTLYENA